MSFSYRFVCDIVTGISKYIMLAITLRSPYNFFVVVVVVVVVKTGRFI